MNLVNIKTIFPKKSFSTEVRDTFLNVAFFMFVHVAHGYGKHHLPTVTVYAENGLKRCRLLRLRESSTLANTFNFRNYTWNENREK